MYYGDDADRKAHIQQRIAMMREAAAVLPLLRASLTKFDGKVYNKRFTDSFKDNTDPNILIISAEHRVYSGSDYVDIYATIYRQYSQRCHICRIELENKRIKAEQAMKSASDCRAELLQKAAEYESYIEKIDEIKSYLEYLETKRKQIVKDIPYETADVFGIKKY